ncbi:hypothetical protein VCHA53O466_40050 [Vibrio chagasii]|nr:hypothetical protein VCHA53O466_40050 [Vibrio chagasii]
MAEIITYQSLKKLFDKLLLFTYKPQNMISRIIFKV